MTNNRKISLGALAALLALPLGVTAFQAVNTAPARAQASRHAVSHVAATRPESETADAPEADAGQPDRDNIQAGPGNTSDNDKETNDGPNTKSDGDGEAAGG